MFLFGAYFKDEKELKFERIRFQLNNFHTWINNFGLKNINHDLKNRSIDVSYSAPDSIEFDISDHLSGKIDFKYSIPFSASDHKFIVEQETTINLSSKKDKISFTQCIHEITYFQHFITLAMFEGTYPLSVTLNNSDYHDKTKDSKKPIDIGLFFIPAFNYIEARNNFPWDYLFSFKDIKEEFSIVIKNWYRHREQLESIIFLLMDSYYQETFNENNFLNISQAIESFHRRFINNRVLSKEDYEKKISEIVENVPLIHQDWLKEKLHFSNSPTLKDRLEDLINNNKINFIEEIIPDKPKFIKKVRDTRNYYTHYSTELKRKALFGNDLFFAAMKLKIVLISHVLLKIGFSIEMIDSLLSKKKYRLFFGLFSKNNHI
jgi:hypothetical protein